MKAQILNVEGEKIREVELPECFSEPIRQDIIQKVYEASKRKQPYAPFLYAGMQYSAAGKLRHARRKWKTTYGYGISRVPRKILTKRGGRFYWVGATVSGARGGREAHPPKVIAMLKKIKINKKEKRKALKSAIAATVSLDVLKKKYGDIKINLPIIVESKITWLGTKEFNNAMKKILGDAYEIAIPKKKKRAGKARKGKYKKIAGALLVIASNESTKSKILETLKVNNLNIKQIAPGGVAGRLCIYTENAIKELEKIK